MSNYSHDIFNWIPPHLLEHYITMGGDFEDDADNTLLQYLNNSPYRDFNLTSKQQKDLAEGITKVHNVVTGANTYFAQVIFNKTKKNNHFMGGKKVKESSIFLLGQIRAGRNSEVKEKLIIAGKQMVNSN